MLWRRSDDWVGSDVDDSLVMVHIETGKYIALNPTAAAVWNALDEPRDEVAIVARLIEEFEISEAACSDAVRRLIADFEQRQLIEAA